MKKRCKRPGCAGTVEWFPGDLGRPPEYCTSRCQGAAAQRRHRRAARARAARPTEAEIARWERKADWLDGLRQCWYDHECGAPDEGCSSPPPELSPYDEGWAEELRAKVRKARGG